MLPVGNISAKDLFAYASSIYLDIMPTNVITLYSNNQPLSEAGVM